ncbi:MAG: hypothetical protein U0X40_11580 [Ferruginibacter sp.]
MKKSTSPVIITLLLRQSWRALLNFFRSGADRDFRRLKDFISS